MSNLQELWNSDREQLRQAREQVAQLRADLATVKDCGQEVVCAITPGCLRHWELRNRELVAELAELQEDRDTIDNARVAAWTAHAAVSAELADTRKALERQDRAVLSMSVAIESARAELAKVTAELAEWRRVAAEHCDSLDIINEACEVAGSSLTAERAAHAETRAALEREQAEHCWEDCCCRESTRAELARSEARVKELETAAKAHLLAGEALLNAAGMEKFSG